MRLKRARPPASVYRDIKDLRTQILKSTESTAIVVATSGGFDPMHVGHLRCIQGAADLGDILVVIVNSDGFLNRKKGFTFMPHEERMEIIAGLAGVDPRHEVALGLKLLPVLRLLGLERPAYESTGLNPS